MNARFQASASLICLYSCTKTLTKSEHDNNNKKDHHNNNNNYNKTKIKINKKINKSIHNKISSLR